MKFIKPILSYIILFLVFILTFFIISKGSLSRSIEIYSVNIIFFNILFIIIYYTLFKKIDLKTVTVLAICSIIINFGFSEFIYSSLLKENAYVKENLEYKTLDNVFNDSINLENSTSNSYLQKAEFYYKNSEYSSAWVYADIYIDNGGENSLRAKFLKDESVKNLKSTKNFKKDERYIDNLYFNNLIQQKKFEDAYYFCLEYLERNRFEYDFLVKYKSSLKRMFDNYYSLNLIDNFFDNPGYTNIKFYNIKGITKSYTIERVVELNDEYFLKNLTIDNVTYPYIYINSSGKIFSNGFREDVRFIIRRDIPEIPVQLKDLKLFSKEYYNNSFISLIYNLKVFNYSDIKYYKNSFLRSLIIKRISQYFIIFFMFYFGLIFNKRKNFLNFLLEFGLSVLFLEWVINKTGLILMNSGLSLAIIFVFIIYIILMILTLLKIKPSLSQS